MRQVPKKLMVQFNNIKEKVEKNNVNAHLAKS